MGPVARIVDGECDLIPGFLPGPRGYQVLHELQHEVPWEQQWIRMFSRRIPSPRLTAWYGDAEAVYRYSGTTLRPLPWFDTLSGLRDLIERYLGCQFNSVLLNYYRNGNDAMGRHSDDEKELGENPVIASLSLGDTRQFSLHPRIPNGEAARNMQLPHGSLLVMSGPCQSNWKHSIPRTRKEVGPRINLTFRNVSRGVR